VSRYGTADGSTWTLPVLGAANERPMDPPTLLRQIGRMNLLAVSGGRWNVGHDGSVILPVRHGYDVRVALAADDTYTVERRWTRVGQPIRIKARWTGVHADQVGDVVYRASCYRDAPEGAEVPT